MNLSCSVREKRFKLVDWGADEVTAQIARDLRIARRAPAESSVHCSPLPILRKVRQMARPKRSLGLLVVVAGIVAATGAGCSSIGGGPLDLFGGSAQPPDIRPGEATYTVEFFDDGKLVNKTTFPLRGPVTVDDALRDARATSEFGRLKVVLLRGRQRMDVDYKNAGDQVDPLSNYTLHQGDRVIVTPDPTSMLDDALKALDSPMAKSLGVP